MSLNANIKYETDSIEAFYKEHRVAWDDFYLSEKVMFEKLNLTSESSVLDIGCGCGGLGKALSSRFNVKDYVGIDINKKAIETAKTLFPEFTFLAGDILDLETNILLENKFDVVVSLSCIDWNIEFDKMLTAAMNCVKPGGVFLSSFRLSNETIKYCDSKSYQYINFQNQQTGEQAPYIILSPKDLFDKLRRFKPSEIKGYGYWASPSKTAITPYEKICFIVLAITKGPSDQCEFSLEIPNDLACNYG